MDSHGSVLEMLLHLQKRFNVTNPKCLVQYHIFEKHHCMRVSIFPGSLAHVLVGRAKDKLVGGSAYW